MERKLQEFILCRVNIQYSYDLVLTFFFMPATSVSSEQMLIMMSFVDAFFILVM